jgi:hypothetical protein
MGRAEGGVPHLLIASEVASVVAIAAVAAWVWSHHGDLPARIPMHFDGAGRPDRWEPGTLGRWLMAPLVGLGAALLMLGTGRLVAWMAGRWPQLVNVPDKDLWLRLTPWGRRWALEPCCAGIAISAVPLAFLFGFIAVQSLEVGHGRRESMAIWPVLVVVGLVFMATIGGVVASVQRIRRASRLGSASP